MEPGRAVTPRTERLWVASLALCAIVVLFIDAQINELHGTAVFYASLVREIVDSGDWMGIYTDDRAYLLKPPLAVWLASASSKVFGLTNFGVTLPSRLAGVLCVLLTYALVRRWWSHGVAFVAAFALLTNSTFIQFSATLRMDSLLLAGFLLSLTGWAYRPASWAPAALFGGLTLAVLSKGPLGFAAIPLIAVHAALLRRAPLRRTDWHWAWLLAPIFIWYLSLMAFHGVRPLSELGADALRESATPEFGVWGSIFAEYGLKPLRRYWPWLPFIALGAAICVRRAFNHTIDGDYRAHYRWVVLWAITVLVLAAVKPDHDIRYLYPALPVLGLFSALAIARLVRERFPAWVPGAAVALIFALSALRWVGVDSATDTRPSIAAIGKALDAAPEVLAIGGFPVRLDQPRRQNTHRDWVHFYTARVPRVLSWSQVAAEPPDFGHGVLLTNSRGHDKRLKDLGLRAKYVTKEMIYAVPE